MKKIILFLTLISFVFASCQGLPPKDVSQEKEPDSADMFVGTYSFSSTQYSKWGNLPILSSNYNGQFSISKVGSIDIKITGFFNGTGYISESLLYIDPKTVSDNAGTINWTYTPAHLSGDGILSFTINGQGELKENNIAYPYTCTMSVAATKEP